MQLSSRLRNGLNVSLCAGIAMLGSILCKPALGSALKVGDIVVAYGTNLAEYTPTGHLVQTFTPANAPDGYNTWEGVTVTADGKLHVLDQQFNNYLTTYNPSLIQRSPAPRRA